jgi:hypothetical protein
LLCALPVDVEQDIATCRKLFLNGGLWRAVAVAKNMRPFQKFSVSRPLLEWLPSSHGLQASTWVLREWLGLRLM